MGVVVVTPESKICSDGILDLEVAKGKNVVSQEPTEPSSIVIWLPILVVFVIAISITVIVLICCCRKKFEEPEKVSTPQIENLDE